MTDYRKKRVLLLHNIIVPYRLPLFEELNKKCDLEVYFCKARSRSRLWAVSPDSYSFKARVLKNITLGPFIINPLLPLTLLRKRFDVYIAGENGLQTIFALFFTFLLAKLFRKPFVVWSGAIDSAYSNTVQDRFFGRLSSLLLIPYRKLIYCYSDSFVAYGNRAKEFLVKRGVEERKIFIGTQVTIEEQNEVVSVTKRDLGFEDKKVILFVGYLKKGKGIEILISAYRKLKRDDTVLVIAGAGKEEDKLKSMTLDREDICFPGYVSGKEKAEYYSIADMFVLPTLHDAWPQVINEAMFYGLPIVTTEEDGSSGELVKDNGFVITAGDVEALRGALEILVDNDKLREEMGAKSLEHIGHYNLGYAVKCFEDAMGFAVDSKKGKKEVS